MEPDRRIAPMDDNDKTTADKRARAALWYLFVVAVGAVVTIFSLDFLPDLGLEIVVISFSILGGVCLLLGLRNAVLGMDCTEDEKGKSAGCRDFTPFLCGLVAAPGGGLYLMLLFGLLFGVPSRFSVSALVGFFVFGIVPFTFGIWYAFRSLADVIRSHHRWILWGSVYLFALFALPVFSCLWSLVTGD